MTTVVKESRQNNFNIIRFIAALMVIAGHMGKLVSVPVPTFLNQQIHVIGVKILFLIGGYLVTKSWISNPSPVRYLCKRAFRIFPALIIFVCLMVFVAGPMLTTLSTKEYFQNPDTYSYLNNIRLYIGYSLPGVFTGNPLSSAVNGSLWTLPVEFFMYLVIPIILICTGAKHQNKRSEILRIAFTAVIILLNIIRLMFFSNWVSVIYATAIGDALQLIVFYLIGSVYTLPFVKKYLNLQISIILVLFASLFVVGVVKSEIILYIVLPYLIFSIAFAPTPVFAKAFQKADYSYGIYIYGFFVQQLVISFFTSRGIVVSGTIYFVISLCITMAFAVVSYYVIEAPAQKLCDFLLSKFSVINKNS